MNKPIIIIAGATACGKTDVSIELAKKINGEIISADSMQVYKKMDIGTAKVDKSKMQGVKHYLVDELDPDEDFSVAVFKDLAKKYINKIYEKDKIPIIVGGTGFYINSIIFDNDFEEVKKNHDYRTYLENIANEKGNQYLSLMLKDVDFESYEKIHYNNTKKIIRALEFFYLTDEKISNHNKAQKEKKLAYDVRFFILNMDRDILYKKINERVDLMIKNNLVEEVKNLISLGYHKNLTSMQGIGYKEIIKYLDGEICFDDAVEQVKKNTRNFAKRQITWFKHQCNGTWIDVLKFENVSQIVESIMKKLN